MIIFIIIIIWQCSVHIIKLSFNCEELLAKIQLTVSSKKASLQGYKQRELMLSHKNVNKLLHPDLFFGANCTICFFFQFTLKGLFQR